MKLINLWHIALTLVCALVLGACSKSSDMEGLLKNVPSDAIFVMAVNGDDAEKQFGVTNEEIIKMPEFQEMMEKQGVNKADLEKSIASFKDNKKVAVAFSDGAGFVLSFYADDEKTLMASFEKNLNVKFSEKNGAQVAKSSGMLIVIKDGRGWLGFGIDTDDVEGYLDLRDDRSFLKNHSDIADKMADKSNLISGYLNITKLSSLAHASSEMAQINMVLEALYNDAASLFFTLRGSKDSLTLEAQVLDKNGKPSECKLPMGKIDIANLAKVDNNAFIVGAVGVNTELAQKVVTMAKAIFPAGEQMAQMIDMFSKLDSTSVFSLDMSDKKIIALSMTDNQAASQAADFVKSMGGTLDAEGNLLVMRQGDMNPAGQPIKEFAGKFFAMRLNMENTEFIQYIGQQDVRLGVLDFFLEKDGNSCKFIAKWQVKDLVRSLIKMAAHVQPTTATLDDDYEVVDDEDWADSALVDTTDYMRE